MSLVMHHVSEVKPAIRFSPSALKHVLSYLAKNPDYKGIRLSVKKTGCSGLSYVVDYVTLPLEHDMTMPLDGDYLVCVDKSSYPYLKDLNIDYVKQGLNYKFIFDNPNQTGQCGCGESFTVD